MSTDNGIKVSRGYTLPDDDGTPNAEEITTFRTSFLSGRACVVVWEDHFKALEADAKAWREQRNALTEAMAKSVFFGDDDDIEDMPLVDVLARAKARFDAVCHEAAERETVAPTPSLADRFPVGRVVMDDDGDSGIVTGHTANEVRVAFGRSPSLVDPSYLTLLPANPCPTPAPWVPKVGERVLVVPLQVVGTVSKVVGPAYAMVDIDGVVRGYAVENLRPAPTPEPTGPEGHVEVVDWRSRALQAEKQCAALRSCLDKYEHDPVCGEHATTWYTARPTVTFPPRQDAPDGCFLCEVAALREKLAAVERERDEARADRAAFLAQLTEESEWEATKFERAAFIAALGSLCANADDATSVTQARSVAAAARAAMFPGEVKA